jgi:transposase
MAKKRRDFDQLEVRRKKAAQLFSKGYRKAHIAAELGVTRGAVGKWHKAFLKYGIKGLAKAPSVGRKRSIGPSEQKWLSNTLLKGAIACGYSTDLWTLDRIINTIKNKTGVVYSESGAWRLLRKLGFSCQKPVTRAIQRDEEKIAHWKKYRWREIKKKRERKSAPSSS